MRVQPLEGEHGFGAVVTELAEPLDAAALRSVWLQHGGLIVVRGFVSADRPERLVELASTIGEVNRRGGLNVPPPDEAAGTKLWSEELRRHVQTGFDQHAVGTNEAPSDVMPSPLDDAGETSLSWHTDQSFILEPAKATCFFCVRCPNRGADTLFVNTAIGWERLEPELQSLAARSVAVHVAGGTNGGAFQSGLDEGNATAHSVVRRHPETGRHCLYLSPENTARVKGIEPASAGRALVQRIVRALLGNDDPERYVYRHVWRVGDAVLWDNRQMIHRATPFRGTGSDNTDRAHKERLMWRVTVRGGVPGSPAVLVAASTLTATEVETARQVKL
jgi:alpha-ketoglutarate-dependent taurine dioxygenase